MAQVQRGMLPAGALMTEHRLIERMLSLMRVELDRIGAYGRADPDFIGSAASFIKEYADICHHGKEERVLFVRLSEKPVSPGLKKMMDDLMEEHVFIRNLTNDLARANESYIQGKPEATADIISSINSIVEFYPRHVEKEEEHFFLPAMDYFSDAERRDMLQTFHEFDSRLFHDEYRMVVSSLEERWHVQPRH
ncbi:hemerythrin domain-containing protein [Methanocella conradii]|uniref:hemerythrin domain-containing protein n=1 Tax=Methanocella conradii TaxID=1175444 RepID=UPI0024B337FC|nr:hemerythrin domain-containing protein [Methanocella conradii]MDI6896995.1 hemerythrin domain-containing protein [Methanocella conradii]